MKTLCLGVLSYGQVDFGCILNDTETIQYVQMTNTSPLEVQYKWYFLRRPPVRRQDPEQCDEGVDMQSECETDSLTEDSQEESQEEEEEEGEDEGDGEGGEVEQTSEREGSLLECDPDKSQEKEAVECSRNDLQASGNSRADENEEGESLESPADTANVQEATAPVVIPTVAASVAEYSDPTAVSVAHVQRREKQPWEVVDDPFKLVRIEQVMRYWCACIYMNAIAAVLKLPEWVGNRQMSAGDNFCQGS